MTGRGNRILTWSVVAVWCIAAGLGVTYWVTESDRNESPSTTSSVPPTTTASAPITTTTRPAPTESLAVAAAGPIVPDKALVAYLNQNGGAGLLAEVMPLFAPAHVASVFLVAPISDQAAVATANVEPLIAPSVLADSLAAAEIDVAGLAGSNMLDAGDQGLFDTIAHLEGASIAHTGAGGNLAAARSPALLDAQPGRVALLAYGEPGDRAPAAQDATAGINPLGLDEEQMLADVTAAGFESDWVIVSLNWQSVTTSTVEKEQRRIAHRLVDAGADLILGSCPHVIQGIEVYRDKVIAYSLGDLAYGSGKGEASLLLSLSLPPSGAPGDFEAVPVELGKEGLPAPAVGDKANETLSWLVRSSSKWGVKLVVKDGRAVFTPAG